MFKSRVFHVVSVYFQVGRSSANKLETWLKLRLVECPIISLASIINPNLATAMSQHLEMSN